MLDLSFRQPICVDDAPQGSRCVWCRAPASLQLIVLGSSFQHETECFCRSCGEEYVRITAESLDRVITDDVTRAV